jgi:hypothetical protein
MSIGHLNPVHSRRQLFANAAIAASRVASLAVSGRAVPVLAIGQRPHPRRTHRGGAATFMTRPRRRTPHTGSDFAFSCVSFGTSNQTFPL